MGGAKPATFFEQLAGKASGRLHTRVGELWENQMHQRPQNDDTASSIRMTLRYVTVFQAT